MKKLLVYKILRVIRNWLRDDFLRSLRSLAYRIRIAADEHFWDKRLGIKTDYNLLAQEDTTALKDSCHYEPTPYHVIESILNRLKFGSDDVFVDLGCGKGRVVLSVAKKKLKKIIGLEAHKDIFNIARDNLEKIKVKNTPVEILNADVTTFDMKEGTIFFMFNPFGMATQKCVIERIGNSLITNPRQVRIICYAGPNISNIDGYDKWLEHENRFSDIHVDVWHSKIQRSREV